MRFMSFSPSGEAARHEGNLEGQGFLPFHKRKVRGVTTFLCFSQVLRMVFDNFTDNARGAAAVTAFNLVSVSP